MQTTKVQTSKIGTMMEKNEKMDFNYQKKLCPEEVNL